MTSNPTARGRLGYGLGAAAAAVVAVVFATIAAAQGRWSAWAGRLATAALVIYLALLAAVFLQP